MKKKLLITGVSGFVAFHFLEYLYIEKIEWSVFGIDIRFPNYDTKPYVDLFDFKFKCVDMVNLNELDKLFDEFTPDYILHLAAYSSVAYSWKDPTGSFMNNSNIFLNLVTVTNKYNNHCRILSVGSSEEYGNVPKNKLPIREDQELNPISPYAVARVSQELLSRVFVESMHMDIILTRSFNHIGPGQDERFVIPSFIKRINSIKLRGEKEGTIITGDTSLIRDFVDVRDVVRAYYLLIISGKAGEVYNICTGRGISLNRVISIISEMLNVDVHTEINQDLVRPADNIEIVGTPYKIESELGWKPKIEFKKSIEDVIKSINVNEETYT